MVRTVSYFYTIVLLAPKPFAHKFTLWIAVACNKACCLVDSNGNELVNHWSIAQMNCSDDAWWDVD